MLATILTFIQPIFTFLSAQYGIVGTIFAYCLTAAPVVTLIIQLLEFIFSFLSNQADEQTALKIDAVWQQILTFLEVLPHANLPVLPFLKYIMSGVAAIKGAIVGWLSISNPPTPSVPPVNPNTPVPSPDPTPPAPPSAPSA